MIPLGQNHSPRLARCVRSPPVPSRPEIGTTSRRTYALRIGSAPRRAYALRRLRERLTACWGSALDAVLQPASIIDCPAAAACPGSHARWIGVIAFDGQRSCAGAARRDRNAYDRDHEVAVTASQVAVRSSRELKATKCLPGTPEPGRQGPARRRNRQNNGAIYTLQTTCTLVVCAAVVWVCAAPPPASARAIHEPRAGARHGDLAARRSYWVTSTSVDKAVANVSVIR